MTQSTKRPPGDPPIPPATKARPSRQMPPASSTQFQPSNHLGGDTQPSVTPNATTQPAVVAPSTSKPKKPKHDPVPDDFDDDEPDPDAAPSGHNGPPILPLDGDEPFIPSPMPENDPQPDTQDQQEPQEEEEEEEEQKRTQMKQFLMVQQIPMRLLTIMILLLMIQNGVSCHRNKSCAVILLHSLCLD